MTVLGLRRCEMAFVTCPCFLRLQHRVLKNKRLQAVVKYFGAYYSSRYKTCVVLGLLVFLFILFYWFIIPKFQG